MKLKSVIFLTLMVIFWAIMRTILHGVKMHYGPELIRLDQMTTKPQECNNCSEVQPTPGDICENCEKEIEKIMDIYSQTWIKNEDNLLKLKSELAFHCNGFDEVIVTQGNTPLMSELVYDGDKTIVNVTEEIFSTLPKTHPFSNKSLDMCAVVGNGGILANSSCGEDIDSSQFVIRCNMPPLEGKFSKDVGTKTDIVTTNPSILVEKYGRLLYRRRPFAKHARLYGNAMLLAPTFSFRYNTELILRAFYTIMDFELKTQPVSMNPRYLGSLDRFWRSHGLNPKKRLTTGLMMASLALEICEDVHLYGFWPFDLHPHTKQPLSHHYYDNRLPKPGAQFMPNEFDLLLMFHTKGVLKLHLGQCPPPK